MQKQFQAVGVAVLRAKMAWSVAITVLGINISSFLQQSLDDREITSDTGNMQRSAHCLGPAVYVATKSMKNLDELNVPLV